MLKKISIFFSLCACWLLNVSACSAEDIEPVHYAYANYLGSGIYNTTGQNATLINLPFSIELFDEQQFTYKARLPISFGFFNFSFDDIPELDLPSGVGTVTFTPGIQVDYQYSKQWLIESYIDMGYARNFTTDRDVFVHSMGISSLYSFDIGHFDSIWANRIYYAAYEGNNYDAQDAYAAFQMGFDLGLPVKYQWFGYHFQPRVFTTAFWYVNEVDFPIPQNATANQKVLESSEVTLSNSFEFGITLKFDKTIGYDWAGINTLGISYRFANNINAVRFLFSFPI